MTWAAAGAGAGAEGGWARAVGPSTAMAKLAASAARDRAVRMTFSLMAAVKLTPNRGFVQGGAFPDRNPTWKPRPVLGFRQNILLFQRETLLPPNGLAFPRRPKCPAIMSNARSRATPL